MELARAAKEAKRQHAQQIKAERASVLLKNKLSSAKETLKSIKNTIANSAEVQKCTDNIILQDLLNHVNGEDADNKGVLKLF